VYIWQLGTGSRQCDSNPNHFKQVSPWILTTSSKYRHGSVKHQLQHFLSSRMVNGLQDKSSA
jgi:hypothetical protein